MAEKYVFARVNQHVPACVRRVGVIFATLVGWVLFYNTDVHGIAAAFGRMFVYAPMDITVAQAVTDNLLFVAACAVAASPLPKNIYLKIVSSVKKPVIAVICEPLYAVAMLLACTGALVGASYSPFLYFRF
jgi:hypothetical protein